MWVKKTYPEEVFVRTAAFVLGRRGLIEAARGTAWASHRQLVEALRPVAMRAWGSYWGPAEYRSTVRLPSGDLAFSGNLFRGSLTHSSKPLLLVRDFLGSLPSGVRTRSLVSEGPGPRWLESSRPYGMWAPEQIESAQRTWETLAAHLGGHHPSDPLISWVAAIIHRQIKELNKQSKILGRRGESITEYGVPTSSPASLVGEYLDQQIAGAESGLGALQREFSDLSDWFNSARPQLPRTIAEALTRSRLWHAEMAAKATKSMTAGLADMGDVVKRWKDGWTMREMGANDSGAWDIDNPEESRLEIGAVGAALGHCYGAQDPDTMIVYQQQIDEADHTLYTLFDPRGRPRASLWLYIQLRDDDALRKARVPTGFRKVEQLRGKGNEIPHAKYHPRLLDFIYELFGWKKGSPLTHRWENLDEAMRIVPVSNALNPAALLRQDSMGFEWDWGGLKPHFRQIGGWSGSSARGAPRKDKELVQAIAKIDKLAHPVTPSTAGEIVGLEGHWPGFTPAHNFLHSGLIFVATGGRIADTQHPARSLALQVVSDFTAYTAPRLSQLPTGPPWASPLEDRALAHAEKVAWRKAMKPLGEEKGYSLKWESHFRTASGDMEPYLEAAGLPANYPEAPALRPVLVYRRTVITNFTNRFLEQVAKIGPDPLEAMERRFSHAVDLYMQEAEAQYRAYMDKRRPGVRR